MNHPPDIIKVDRKKPERNIIRFAASLLERGMLIVIPTETVYGLAADARNKAAVMKIYKIKNRKITNKLPLQVHDIAEARRLTSALPNFAEKIMKEFWPGPLTMICRAANNVPEWLTGPEKRLGIRIPDELFCLYLLKETGFPLVVTSANLSGEEPAKSAADLTNSFAIEKGIQIFDAGKCSLGRSSTVLDITRRPPLILRNGPVTKTDIESAIGGKTNQFHAK